MITQHAWMFLSSYEKLREEMLDSYVVNMAHLGPRAFEEIGGEVVQTTAFVLCNEKMNDYRGTYCRLTEPTTQDGKRERFLSEENRYYVALDSISYIDGRPFAYWTSKNK